MFVYVLNILNKISNMKYVFFIVIFSDENWKFLRKWKMLIFLEHLQI